MSARAESRSAETISDLLTVREAAQVSRFSASTLWRYIKSGHLPKVQIGGRNCRVLLRCADLSALSDEVNNSPSAAREPISPKPSRKLSGRAPAWRDL
ncbi:helix-turn-helix transcriptional regulator [Lacipirellula sp.]|uniref:helix-turn-helix transcriptional regulator n=1 Tax=Lacipirellula sp. TaxID=2691419 RepID=UPI003D0CF6BA